ncbi:LicD family protein [Labilibacter marinus]|uniref:LicD family protein n=1 Tax=Labilibacter marinus TaxID=1477105 RepID=UPI00082EA43B|nr:LicD family protein [Labilibacter marinus]
MEYDIRVREKSDEVLKQAQLVMLEVLKVIDKICSKYDIKYWLDAGTLLGAVRHKGFIPWDDDLDICMIRSDYEKFISIVESELPEGLFLQTRDTDHSIWKWAKIRDVYSTFIQKTEVDKSIKYHQGIFVDIFPYDIIEDTFNKNKLFINRRYHLSKNKKVKKMSGLLNMLATIAVKTVGFNRWKNYFLRKNSGNNMVSTGIDITVGFCSFEYDTMFPLRKIEFEGLSFYGPNKVDEYLTHMYGDYMSLPPEDQRKVHAHKILPFNKCNHPKSKQY